MSVLLKEVFGYKFSTAPDLKTSAEKFQDDVITLKQVLDNGQQTTRYVVCKGVSQDEWIAEFNRVMSEK